MSGPAPRDMDRVRVVVHHSAVTLGSRPTASERQEAVFAWLASHRRTLPTDYCSPTIPQ
ncbi:MAG TPA: hypothetical protein VKO35_12355 [Acidimicrobiia bacterium]|nr:hypothetical protein [Acidimicrobiia bacterium]